MLVPIMIIGIQNKTIISTDTVHTFAELRGLVGEVRCMSKQLLFVQVTFVQLPIYSGKFSDSYLVLARL